MNITYTAPEYRGDEYNVCFCCTEGDHEYRVGGQVSLDDAKGKSASDVVKACYAQAEPLIAAWLERIAVPKPAAPKPLSVPKTVKLTEALTATKEPVPDDGEATKEPEEAPK